MMSTALAGRIRRLIPSLASNFDGEVIATRNAIGRELAAGGSDWHALADSITGIGRPPTKPLSSAAPTSFGDLARACRDLDGGRLSHNDRTFVFDMCRRGWSFVPSPKQARYMSDLYRRLSSGRAAA